jgi:CheY-like chemotaxis protein
VCQDATLVWVHRAATLLRDASGRTARVLGTAYDVAKRKHAGRALHNATQRLAATLESIADGLIVLRMAQVVSNLLTNAAKYTDAGRGTQFTVTLPLVETAASSDDPAAAPGAVPRAKADAADAGRRKGASRRVMVADDNRDSADTLAMILEIAGHEVRVAHDGRAALALAAEFQPEFALLDLGMPELSGYDVARALRREPWGRTMQLIALTGWGQDADRQRAAAAGFDRHLTKPVDPAVIEALLAGA